MQDCIFCRIAAGEVPTNKVYEDDDVFAFYDMAPQAPVHVLIVPKAHAANLLEARALPEKTLARLLTAAAEIAEALGLSETGFRIISNCGPDACQSVQHLHIHLLGGAQLSEKMA